MTQGRTSISALRRRPMTYHGMLRLGISVCPWKRVVESLAEDERLIKASDGRGNTTWRVVVVR